MKYVRLIVLETSILGWFVDEKSTNHEAANSFIQALTAATNLTEGLLWPKGQYTFQSIHENVNVCITDLQIYSTTV